ncbi:MAG: hypothetical protein ABIJ14_03305 [Nanoarchaeota archaeon]
MESSNLYYSFSLDEDLEIPVESVLELGEKLKRVRDYLRGEYNPLINKFGVDLLSISESSYLRFWTVDINSKSFYESLFEKAGYFNRAEVSKNNYKLLFEILKENDILFKGKNFMRAVNKEIIIKP